MKNYHLTTLFLTLFVCTANHAQTITFNFTEGTTSSSGYSWTQTVGDVTCTATFDADNSGLDVATLSGSTRGTFIDSSEGMYMGRYVIPAAANQRIGFARPGARITFNQDVRLKSYTLGRLPGNDYTVCVFAGGNVTGIASHAGGPDDHEGERAFALESLIPAGQTIATTVVGNGFQSSVWRIKTLTVELEPYVAPEIPIVEGSETGISRISTAYFNNSKHNFVLKNGRLHVWADGGYESVFDSRDFIFDGGESGVLDFWTSTGVTGELTILMETVEGFVLFESPRGRQIVRQFVRNLPDSPDQIGLLMSGTEAAVVALKDGFVYFDGWRAEELEAAMPAELISGGVSEIAVGGFTVLAVKGEKLYTWGIPTHSNAFTLRDTDFPDAVTNGSILHLAAYELGAVAQLTSGEVIPFGFGAPTLSLSADQTSGEIFADLRYENDNLVAIRADGSFLMEDEQIGINVARYNVYDGGPFYVEDTETSSHADFWLRGLETPPTIVQQLGYEQISFGRENAMALLPGGRVVIWGGVDIATTGSNSASPIQTEAVPAQINEILFPQNVAPIVQHNRPNVGELLMLQEGGLGIQWGGNGNPQYEVQTTTDINDDTSWEALPVGTNPELRYYRIREITEETP